MPLPSECAFDTESGICPDGEIRNVLIQYCSSTAHSPEEVFLLCGEDCYDRFLLEWEATGWDVDMYFYNSKWEGRTFIESLIACGYRYCDKRKLPPSSWYAIEDPMKIYRITVTNARGYTLTICDDLLHTVCRMEKAADLVRKEEPGWFESLGEFTKLHIDEGLYNVWYTLPEDDPDRKLFLEYSKVDAFSQAMICRWLTSRGHHEALTSASNGLRTALKLKYGQESDFWNRKQFTRKYPPLPREMQDIVEDSLLGGYVWGLVGIFHGTFCHPDYKSSYPKEYADGKLFRGPVRRIVRGDRDFETFRKASDENYMLWYVVSFSFRLREGYMPAISGIMCKNRYEPMRGLGNKKMKEGTVEHKLVTSSYFRELKKHYRITDVFLEEVWVAKPHRGDFKGFIRECFTQKERKELKGTMERDMWKRAMNAGIHGKTITKTHREKVVYYNGRETVQELNEPKLCSLIGFTAMMNARERLLRHCRMVIEAGHRVLMCDTDSMVCDCSSEELVRILGEDAFEHGVGFNDLGKFEFEEDQFGRREFNVFKCWGLKRYCELNEAPGEVLLRKTAFAGMHDESQYMLMDLPVEMGKMFKWTQDTKHWNGHCYVLDEMEKQAKAEDIWFESVDKDELEKEYRKRGLL